MRHVDVPAFVRMVPVRIAVIDVPRVGMGIIMRRNIRVGVVVPQILLCSRNPREEVALEPMGAGVNARIAVPGDRSRNGTLVSARIDIVEIYPLNPDRPLDPGRANEDDGSDKLPLSAAGDDVVNRRPLDPDRADLFGHATRESVAPVG